MNLTAITVNDYAQRRLVEPPPGRSLGVTKTARRLTVGVEEELFAVDPITRTLAVDPTPILNSAVLQSERSMSYGEEFRLSMLEARTSPCLTLEPLRAEVATLRQGLIQAASQSGHLVAAAGSFPMFDWRTQQVNPMPRYQKVANTYARMAYEHVVCGCHVHVGIDNRDLAVDVMNRVRPWLPLLLALSSSSPFWMGEDTGYASYRSVIWARWPIAGPPPPFRSFADYTEVVEGLIENQTLVDKGQVFWDVRPGTKHETLEFRVADSCSTVNETMVQAGLCRALVGACLDEVAGDKPAVEVSPEMLRAAKWRASRFGLLDTLLDPFSGKLVPAATLADQLVEYVRCPLEDTGDWDEVTMLVERILREGSSAQRQRRVFAESNKLADVVDLLVEETALD